MKRFFTLLLATLTLTAALCITASASDFDATAQELSAIGMFRGNGSGFALDRAPTRAEAAIMLVRLYGAEETANADYQAGTISHPFSDVPSFSAPHVAWLYTQGLTKGKTAETFGSNEDCSAQSYATFLLRALGYRDGVDFEYKNALSFAQAVGFYDPSLFEGPFLRDDLAALTYQALATDTKDSGTSLLSSLVESGAVSREAAGPMMEKFESYRQVIQATAALNADALDMSTDLAMDITMDMGGVTISLPTTVTGRTAVKMQNGALQMACTTTTTVDGDTSFTDIWVRDNWVYLSAQEGPVAMKFKYPAEAEDLEESEVDISEVGLLDVNGLAMVNSISTTKSGANTVYTMVIDGRIGGMMDAVNELLEDDTAQGNIQVGDITATYVVGPDGVLKQSSLVFSCLMDMNVDMDDGSTVPVKAAYDYNMVSTINATGNQVTISFPDFSGFVEIDPSSLED